METRSNNVLVGGIVLAMIAALLGFTVWLSSQSGNGDKRYDIFFTQAVDGLAKGSPVAFQGFPVGKIEQIALEPNRPDRVRVRIAIDPSTPVLLGTAATIQGIGFTGVSQVQLDGSVRGRQPITMNGPYGVPVIPAKPGGFAAILSSAPELLDRVSTLTERLAVTLNDRNQESLSGILENFQDISRSLAARSPEIAATLVETREAVRQSAVAAQKIGNLAESTNGLVQRDGRGLTDDARAAVANLKQTTAVAQNSIRNLDAAISDARPGLQALSKQTIPEVGLLVSDLRDTASSLSSVSKRLDQGGATAILGAPKLPEYKASKK